MNHSHTMVWYRIHLVWLIAVGISVTLTMHGIVSDLVVLVWIGSFVVLVLSGSAVLLFTVFGQALWLMNLVAKFSGGTVVKVMTALGKEFVTVAYSTDQQNQLTAYLPWPRDSDQIILLPNGYVSLNCDSVLGCIWHPLDPNLLVEMALTSSNFPDWQQWKNMTIYERLNGRIVAQM